MDGIVGGLIAFAVVAGLVLLFVLPWFLFKPQREKFRQKQWEEAGGGETIPDGELGDPTPVFAPAQVVSRRICHEYWIGSGYMPKNIAKYYLTFKTEDGEKEYVVSEELFSKTEEGQTGTLVTINGMFFDFGDGEPQDEE